MKLPTLSAMDSSGIDAAAVGDPSITVERLVLAYRDRTIQEIAGMLGISAYQVRSELGRAGVKIRTAADVAALRRRNELNDRDWLGTRYETHSVTEIATELGVNSQRVSAALRRLGIQIRSRHETLRRRNPLLHDPVRLQQRVAESSVDEVALSLGVSRIGVQAALRRGGRQSAHRYNGKTPVEQPVNDQLARWWVPKEQSEA